MGDKNKRAKSQIKRAANPGREPHRIVWNKVNHGKPPIKHKQGWVERILANKEDAKKNGN